MAAARILIWERKLVVNRGDIWVARGAVKRGIRQSVSLSQIQSRIMAALVLKMDRGRLHRYDLLDFIYNGNEPDGWENSTSVQVCMLRKRIKHLGLNISNTHGLGWELVIK